MRACISQSGFPSEPVYCYVRLIWRAGLSKRISVPVERIPLWPSDEFTTEGRWRPWVFRRLKEVTGNLGGRPSFAQRFDPYTWEVYYFSGKYCALDRCLATRIRGRGVD